MDPSNKDTSVSAMYGSSKVSQLVMDSKLLGNDEENAGWSQTLFKKQDLGAH